MSRKVGRTRHGRRQAMALRASVCREAAIAAGWRHAAPLVDVLADYGTISDNLPWVAQSTMARRLGVTTRTVRRWLAALEAIGVVRVYRSPARPDRWRGGRLARRTNRYLLVERAGRLAHGGTRCPVPRRRRQTTRSRLGDTTVPSPPRGLELGGGGGEVGDNRAALAWLDQPPQVACAADVAVNLAGVAAARAALPGRNGRRLAAAQATRKVVP